MAVTLPSDLIADVMRAADPARMKTAAARLADDDQPSIVFANVMEGVERTKRVRDRTDDLIADVLGAADRMKVAAAEKRLSGDTPASVLAQTGQDETYKAFEQMVLRNMFESMMPSAESGIYGEGASAGIWRSLANDQLAGVYADWGGLGIARTLSGSVPESGVSARGQWPYFETTSIRSFTG